MFHLIDIKDLSVEEIQNLLDTAEDIIANPKHIRQIMFALSGNTLSFKT